MPTMVEPIRVLICGAGSGSHALAGIISMLPGVEVRVFIDKADKVCRWREQMNSHGLTVTVWNENNDRVKFAANPFLVTDNPEEAARHCDLIILALPAFLHWQYLNLLAPYIEERAVIIGLPGQSGFEFDVRKALGPKVNTCVVMNFESLPWICRLVELGKAVDILGTKKQLAGALQGNLAQVRIADPVGCLQSLLGDLPKLVVSGHLLGMTLMSPNYCHPPMMYGRWKDWNGSPLEQPPLFYHGIDESTSELVDKISDEVLKISYSIAIEFPNVDLSHVIPLYEWDIIHYGNYIKDRTNLMTTTTTNSRYEGITHPMLETIDGKYMPNFNQRFLTEDVPFGLVVIRGIAELTGVQTPYMDTVLSWCQNKMEKEYLVGSRLVGKDLATTRCPQRYGFKTLADILTNNL